MHESTDAFRAPWSVRVQLTVVATLLAAIALALSSLLILRLVESDLVEAADRALIAELELELETVSQFVLPSIGAPSLPTELGAIIAAGDLAVNDISEVGGRMAEDISGFGSIDGDQSVANDFIQSELALGDLAIIEMPGVSPISGSAFDFEMGERSLGLGIFTRRGSGNLATGLLYENGEPIAELTVDRAARRFTDARDPRSGEPVDVLHFQDLVVGAVSVGSVLLGTDTAAISDIAFLVGARSRAEVDGSVVAVRDALVLIVPGLVVVLAGLIWWLSGRAMQPVQAMATRVQSISTSNLDQRVPVPRGNDAVATLARLTNGMLERLERGDAAQRRFAADASHELRSPLSALRAAAEIIAVRPRSERVPTLASDIVAEADRMEVLIADMLELSRLDELDQGAGGIEWAQVDLRDLIIDLLDTLAHQADAPGASNARVAFAAPDLAVTISASRPQILRMIRNLVVNAQRHAREQVIVSLDHSVVDADVITIMVEDDGSGIDEADRERIFERFSRLDEARGRDAGGIGLGLALVRAVANHHHGQVSVERSSRLGGAAFIVTLPAL